MEMPILAFRTTNKLSVSGCRLVKEHFIQNLASFVVERQSGLPAHDVVMLAFMLLDGLTTIHEYAKSLHLHVQPVNVMFEMPGPEDDGFVLGIGPRSVRLADGVLHSGRLPVALANKIAAGMS